MRCPNCGAKFQKSANICLKCGTKLSQIQNASNLDALKARQEYQPDKIVYSTVWPKDLNYKKTLLLSIFFGLFGAHKYYTRNYLGGILYSIFSVLFIVYFGVLGLIYQGYSLDFVTAISNSQTLSMFTGLISMIGALMIILWVWDIIKICTKTFKVPVVLADR